MRGEMQHFASHRLDSVVPGRLELPTSTLSVWRSNQLSYRTSFKARGRIMHSPPAFPLVSIYKQNKAAAKKHRACKPAGIASRLFLFTYIIQLNRPLQKGGVPAAPSGTATLLRLSPNHQFRPRPILAVTDFRRPRLSWLDGRCVQGPGTYSPRHG